VCACATFTAYRYLTWICNEHIIVRCAVQIVNLLNFPVSLVNFSADIGLPHSRRPSVTLLERKSITSTFYVVWLKCMVKFRLRDPVLDEGQAPCTDSSVRLLSACFKKCWFLSACLRGIELRSVEEYSSLPGSVGLFSLIHGVRAKTFGCLPAVDVLGCDLAWERDFLGTAVPVVVGYNINCREHTGLCIQNKWNQLPWFIVSRLKGSAPFNNCLTITEDAYFFLPKTMSLRTDWPLKDEKFKLNLWLGARREETTYVWRDWLY
jgi:hypothetical protein